jgi:hypothetical protein
MFNSTAVNSSAGSSLNFDLFRLTKAKQTVDLCPNTLRKFNRQGLPFYKRGRAVFVSKSELEQFIRNPSAFKLAA